MIALWNIVPCSLAVDRRFRDAYCLHHQVGHPVVAVEGGGGFNNIVYFAQPDL
jgi:hypothetical protein